MKIYFEDGILKKISQIPVSIDYKVDAAHGVESNIQTLDIFKQQEKTNKIRLTIYTNSIFAFSNRYAWDDDLKVPEIYIRSGENMVFTRIDKLTSRQLREGHNLAKMYVSGEFSNRK